MTDLIPADIQLPAHLAERMSQPSSLAQSLGGGMAQSDEGGFPVISIKGGRFRIKMDGEEKVLDSTKLEVIVVGANPAVTKQWYKDKWTPDSEPSAPNCYSLDGKTPHPEAEEPQNDLCASCPKNAWGSATNAQGNPIKACSDEKRLAVVPTNKIDGPVYLLRVTPAALKGLNAYQKELSMRGIPAEIVKTFLSFDTNASFPKLQFSFAGFMDEAQQAKADLQFGSEAVKVVTGETQAAIKVPKPAEEPKPVLVKESAPAPAPQEEPATDFGFDAEPAAPAAKAEAPKKEKVVEEPKPAAVASGADDLAAEIAALVGEVSDD